MIDYATNATRINPTEHRTSNDRYAMRCFLLRLGFIGQETKTARRVLTRNLAGNGAWRTPPKATTPPAVQETPRVEAGCRIRLLDDSEAEPALTAGMEGEVMVVDALGTIHVDWDNGTSLGLISEVDHFRIIDTPAVKHHM